MSSTRRRNSLEIARRRKHTGAVLAAGVLALSLAGAASAKEIGSGTGGGITTTTCNPVSALSYKGDARVGETGLASVDINYSVKPCDANPVRVSVSMYESASPSTVVYSDDNAALSNRITVFGVKTNFSYQVKVAVYDATTGTLSGSKIIFAAANRKVGV